MLQKPEEDKVMVDINKGVAVETKPDATEKMQVEEEKKQENVEEKSAAVPEIEENEDEKEIEDEKESSEDEVLDNLYKK